MKKWHIKVDGKQQGPFVPTLTIEELRKLKSRKKFDRDTFIWHFDYI